jgi:hypothetical protein
MLFPRHEPSTPLPCFPVSVYQNKAHTHRILSSNAGARKCFIASYRYDISILRDKSRAYSESIYRNFVSRSQPTILFSISKTFSSLQVSAATDKTAPFESEMFKFQRSGGGATSDLVHNRQ